jgi:hypothetical protein
LRHRAKVTARCFIKLSTSSYFLIQNKRTSTFTWSVFLCVFAGSFQYGYNISSVNGPALFVKNDLYGVVNSNKSVFGRAPDDKDGVFALVGECEAALATSECEECGENLDCKMKYIDYEDEVIDKFRGK